jgi:dTDP-4-amino-4,6-dideoxy-D-galactose acyltransferase
METNYLEWDSGFFGRKVYAVRFNQGDSLKDLRTMISEKQPDLMYVFTHPSVPRALLESIGGKLYDQKVTFVTTLDPAAKYTTITEIVDYKGPATDALIKLGLKAGEHSRFLLDPQLTSKFNEFYTNWVVNSLNGTLADKMFVAEQDQQPIGMITCKIKDNTGNIGLVAVADGYQGKGWGGKLVTAVHNYYQSLQVTKSTVVTQLDNEQACQFYKKMGFTIGSIENIYHLWRDQIS